MNRVRCPGQDLRYWKPEDIFLLDCPYCDHEIEFWKDEPFRLCRNCEREVRNPRIDLGCAKWCKFAADCLGSRPDDPDKVVPVTERIVRAAQSLFADSPERLESGRQRMQAAEDVRTRTGRGAAAVIKASALLLDLPERDGVNWQKTARQFLTEAGLDEAISRRIISVISAVNSAEADDCIEARIVAQARFRAS